MVLNDKSPLTIMNREPTTFFTAKHPPYGLHIPQPSLVTCEGTVNEACSKIEELIDILFHSMPTKMPRKCSDSTTIEKIVPEV